MGSITCLCQIKALFRGGTILGKSAYLRLFIGESLIRSTHFKFDLLPQQVVVGLGRIHLRQGFYALRLQASSGIHRHLDANGAHSMLLVRLDGRVVETSAPAGGKTVHCGRLCARANARSSRRACTAREDAFISGLVRNAVAISWGKGGTPVCPVVGVNRTGSTEVSSIPIAVSSAAYAACTASVVCSRPLAV